MDSHIAARKKPRLTPSQIILVGFACMILIGACLLTLPHVSQSGESVGFLDALFTATSATCVTGLVVVDTQSHWSLFGKVVILLLIQLGGLGFVAIMTASMVLLKRRISLKSRIIVQVAFNQDHVGGMVRLVKRVLVITLCIEAIGAVFLTLLFWADYPLREALGMGIFHAISAFCNAGFDIIGPGSLIPYQTNLLMNLVITSLIISGGLGFTVWGELLSRKKGPKARRNPLSLHSKITLSATGILLVSGTALFLLFEWTNPGTLASLTGPQKALASFFQSVTLRTCGFYSIPQGELTDASKFVSCLYMMIGGSPVSTAGGMKTVTLGIIVIAILSAIRGRDKLEAFERTLPPDLLQKALTVASIMIVVVFVSTMILYFTERNSPFPHDLLDLFYEISSAAGTVGLTTGITPHLSAAGKITAILCMFLGRLSPMTVVVALSIRQHKTDSDSVSFIEERVLIG